MKLILLLIAIYSLIFYQHYKIQKSKGSPQESTLRTTKSNEQHRLTDKQDYKTAIFLMRNNNEKLPESSMNRAALYQ